MTLEFVKRKPKSFFHNKKAILNSKQENIGGEIIESGSIVQIIGKNRSNLGIDIKDENGIIIYNVWPEYIDLIK